MPSHDSTERKPQEQAEEAVKATHPPLLDYLQNKERDELASRLVALIEAMQKATIETSAEQRKWDAEFRHRTMRLWLALQSVALALIIAAAVALAWYGKLDATVAALMGTLFGYFLGRALR